MASRLRGLRGLSLLASFGLLSAIPLGLLAVALGISLHRIIEQRALESTRSQAVFTATVGVAAYFHGGKSTTSPQQLLGLEQQLVRLRRDGQLSGLAFWRPQGTFRFGSVPAFAGTPELARARAGETVSEVRGDQMVVDVPVSFTGRAKTPDGVLVAAIPYALVRARVDHDTKVLYLIVLAGFALLYALLLPIVARASRRLRRQSEENERLARHDVLTGLPNRMYFQELLDGSDRARTGAIVVDLDRFKSVNDRYGHHVGDELLACVGERLRRAVREDDVVARLGGDEFAILVQGGADETTLETLAQRIVAAVAEPVRIGELTLHVHASVGASPPLAAADADELVRLADAAMYSAKNAGGDSHRLHDAARAA